MTPVLRDLLPDFLLGRFPAGYVYLCPHDFHHFGGYDGAYFPACPERQPE